MFNCLKFTFEWKINVSIKRDSGYPLTRPGNDKDTEQQIHSVVINVL